MAENAKRRLRGMTSQEAEEAVRSEWEIKTILCESNKSMLASTLNTLAAAQAELERANSR